MPVELLRFVLQLTPPALARRTLQIEEALR